MLDFQSAKCESRFMLNKLKINPNTDLPQINSVVSNDNFLFLLKLLESSTDITPNERCTLLLLLSNFSEELKIYYVKNLIGHQSTWYRNLERLIRKGYLIKESAQNE